MTSRAARWLQKALGKGKGGRAAAEAHVTKGYVAAREGRLQAARQHYSDAIDADRTLAVAFFNAAQVELELFNHDQGAGRLTAVAEYLRQGLACDATHAPSWRTLARVCERQHDYSSALDAWTQTHARLITADPPADPKEIEDARRQAIRLHPFVELDAALTNARSCLAHDDVTAIAAALNALQQTWERTELAGVDEPPRLFTLLGALARKASQLEQARAFFDIAVARDPRDLEALKELATTCLGQGDLSAALTASTLAYRADPLDAGLVCNVGVCHLALGELAQAREFIELAAGMAPKDPIVVRALAALPTR